MILLVMKLLPASLFPLAAALGMSPVSADEPVAIAPVPSVAEAPAVKETKLSVSSPAAKQDTQITPSVKTEAPIVQLAQADLSEQPELITPKPAELSREKVLEKASAALKASKTARGAFTQTDTYGDRVTGDFYIRRPGKIRFEYGSPVRLLVISDGSTVSYQDMELETDDRIPLKATPLKLFLGKDVDLNDGVNVVDVRSVQDRHLIYVEDNRSSEEDRIEGQLILMFARDSFDLMGWLALDETGGQTRVDLTRVEQNVDISPRLFVIEDDEDDRRDR